MHAADVNQAAWDTSLTRASSSPSLLQGWAWGEAQRQMGWDAIERVRLSEAQASVQCQKVGPVRWGYVPRGPVESSEAALAALAVWARGAGLARLRVEPDGPPELADVLRGLGFRPATAVQPVRSLLVALLPDAELLASFRSNHRYSLRVAERRGVSVREGADAEALAGLVRATAGRHGIHLPSAAYLRLLLESLEGCRTYLARVEGEVAAGALVGTFCGRAYYLYAGSSGAHRDAMPAYAALWAAMRAARDRGCTEIDLWGIAPTDDPQHPWAGLSLFKRGFGGRQVDYVGAWDLDLSPSATLLDWLEKLRHAARRMRARARRGSGKEIHADDPDSTVKNR